MCKQTTSGANKKKPKTVLSAQFWSTRTMLRQCQDLIMALSGLPYPLMVDQTSARITPGTGQGSVWSTRPHPGRPDTPDRGFWRGCACFFVIFDLMQLFTHIASFYMMLCMFHPPYDVLGHALVMHSNELETTI